jgi:hypothetical protein
MTIAVRVVSTQMVLSGVSRQDTAIAEPMNAMSVALENATSRRYRRVWLYNAPNLQASQIKASAASNQ